jgi:hypothetical protein
LSALRARWMRSQAIRCPPLRAFPSPIDPGIVLTTLSARVSPQP